MGKAIGRNGSYKDLAVVALFVVSGCTGVASLPRSGSGSGGGNATGSTTGSGTAGNGSVTGVGGSGIMTDPMTGKPVVTSLWDKLPAINGLDSGRAVLRRLNNAEYDNTVRDLLGTMMTPKPSAAYMFPADEVNELFDTNGQTLVFTSFLFSQLQQAAQGLVDEFMARPANDPIRTRILTCTPTLATLSTCLTTVLTPFMTTAYRRPVSAAEVGQVVTVANSIAQAHMDATFGTKAALQAVLLSPNFLFRLETSTPPTGTTPVKINDYELATRLSYFVGSTMPDAQLTAAAAAGKLTPAGPDYASQVDRLISDPTRLQAFVDNFAGRWLSIRDTALVAPDAPYDTMYDEALRVATPQETSLFFSSLVSTKQPLSTLLTANYTFVNARLAQHYGLPSPAGTGFSKVTLGPTSQRMGFLTQETYLAVTSLPARTSPVKRGVWILENLLCDGTPAPPANVPDLPPEGTGTVRQVLEAHRSNAFCSSCHSVIDPFGLAMENYDAIGAYRTQDNGHDIDASSQMADGTSVSGPLDLANKVAQDPRFALCVTKQALTFAVGRSFEQPDGRAYVKTVAGTMGAGAGWPDLIKAVAMSDAFRTSRGEGP
jgi:hypothetical protein